MPDEIGGVAEPSIMTYYNQVKIVTRWGSPVSNWDTTSATRAQNNKQARLLES